jgi:hypothetical protein
MDKQRSDTRMEADTNLKALWLVLVYPQGIGEQSISDNVQGGLFEPVRT